MSRFQRASLVAFVAFTIVILLGAAFVVIVLARIAGFLGSGL